MFQVQQTLRQFNKYTTKKWRLHYIKVKEKGQNRKKWKRRDGNWGSWCIKQTTDQFDESERGKKLKTELENPNFNNWGSNWKGNWLTFSFNTAEAVSCEREEVESIECETKEMEGLCSAAADWGKTAAFGEARSSVDEGGDLISWTNQNSWKIVTVWVSLRCPFRPYVTFPIQTPTGGGLIFNAKLY